MQRSRACPDCPATRTRTLAVLVDRPSGCALRCLSVRAREPLPAGWGDEYGIALVRRGVIVRHRIDARGDAVAIDAAGPGSAVSLSPSSDSAVAAYAADDAMLCLCPRPVLDDAIDGGRDAARDVVRAQSAMLVRVERFADARGRRSAAARLAALLLALADTLVASAVLEVIPAALRQRDLAALAALRHESICRELRALESAGRIARVESGLRILDRVALEHA
jgi:CRP-like cAMP-binding protein